MKLFQAILVIYLVKLQIILTSADDNNEKNRFEIVEKEDKAAEVQVPEQVEKIFNDYLDSE